MIHDEIIACYDDLIRLAYQKGLSRADAEDLVGDVMLAAFAALARSETIRSPKTWLNHTFFHKYCDQMRRKYRTPVTVCLDDALKIAEAEDAKYLSTPEAAEVRRELNTLSARTREVLIRYYYGNMGVAQIAEELGIPVGTVKSRLSAGRDQMRKGLKTMQTNWETGRELRENCVPGELNLSFGGAEGCHGEPLSLVENDRIAQNLLMLAYEKPLSIEELSRAIGIPAAYLEPIVQKLFEGELMAQTNGGRVYADFIITDCPKVLASFRTQLDFAHRHFDAVWDILTGMLSTIRTLPCTTHLSEASRTMLERYAVLRALQNFAHFGTNNIEAPHFPRRKDGGRWFAHAIAFEGGYNRTEYRQAMEYAIQGGHRATAATVDGGTRRVCLYEFDTTLWDSPHRYGFAPNLYFQHIIPFLWGIYAKRPLAEAAEIPAEFFEHMPTMALLGLIETAGERPCVKLPVLSRVEYEAVCRAIRDAVEHLKSAIGASFATLFRYIDATRYFPMAIVAYKKGLHLNGLTECRPPVVLVYDDAG